MKDTTFINEAGNTIAIHWDDLKYQHIETIDHSKIFECRGHDDNDIEYTGMATFACCEVDEITDIEVLNESFAEKTQFGVTKPGFHKPVIQ